MHVIISTRAERGYIGRRKTMQPGEGWLPTCALIGSLYRECRECKPDSSKLSRFGAGAIT